MANSIIKQFESSSQELISEFLEGGRFSKKLENSNDLF